MAYNSSDLLQRSRQRMAALGISALANSPLPVSDPSLLPSGQQPMQPQARITLPPSTLPTGVPETLRPGGSTPPLIPTNTPFIPDGRNATAGVNPGENGELPSNWRPPMALPPVAAPNFTPPDAPTDVHGGGPVMPNDITRQPETLPMARGPMPISNGPAMPSNLPMSAATALPETPNPLSAPVIHDDAEHHGFGNRLRHALTGLGSGALIGLHESGLAGAIGGAAAGGIMGGVRPQMADRLKYEAIDYPRYEVQQARADQQAGRVYAQQKRDLDLQGEQSQIDLRKAQTDQIRSPQPKGPLVLKPGEIAYLPDGSYVEGPDANGKTVNVPPGATVFDTRTQKPIYTAPDRAASPAQDRLNQNDQAAAQANFDKLVTQARQFKAEADAHEQRAGSEMTPNPDAEYALAQQKRQQAENLYSQADSLGAQSAQRHGGTYIPYQSGRQEPVWKAPGRNGQTSTLSAKGPASTAKPPSAKGPSGPTRSLSDLKGLLK